MPRNTGMNLANMAIRVSLSGGKKYPVFSEESELEFPPDDLLLSVDTNGIVMDELQFSADSTRKGEYYNCA